MYISTGILRYSCVEDRYSLRVVIDPEITAYYRKLIPKSISSRKQMYEPHISVVRKELPVNLDYWNKYEGKEVDFFYDGIIHFSENYCWLNIFSNRLEEIRIELGLPVSSQYTLPPEGFTKCFHTTLGNFKVK